MAFAPLVYGSQGAEVTTLQQNLLQLGLIQPANALFELVSATVGIVTTKAILEVQKSFSVPITGDYDYATWKGVQLALVERDRRRSEPVAAVVVGKVLYPNSNPASGLTVKITQREMRQEQNIATTTIDSCGLYIVEYKPAASVGLVVRIIGKNGQILYEPDVSSILFDAPLLAIVSINLTKGDTAVPNQFESVLKALTPLVKDVPFDKLRDDSQVPDIQYLSKQTQYSESIIAQFALSYRLEAQYQLPPLISYALFAENTLLTMNTNGASGIRFSLNLTTPLEPLFYDIVLLSDSIITAAVTNAVETDHFVPAMALDQLPAALALLKGYLSKAQQYVSETRSQAILDDFQSWVSTDRITSITNALSANVFGNFGTLIQGLQSAVVSQLSGTDTTAPQTSVDPKSTQQSSEGSKDTALSASSKTLASADNVLGSIMGHNDALISAAMKIKSIKDPKDVQGLGRLSQQDWEALLNQAVKDKDVASDSLQEGLIPVHAIALTKLMEKRFPTSAFLGSLERDSSAFPGRRDLVLKFLTNSPTFDLAKTNVDRFVKDNPQNMTTQGSQKSSTEGKTGIAPAKSSLSETVRHIKALQRIFKFAPTFPQAKALAEKGITAAAHIHSIGEKQFVKMFSATNGAFSEKEAKAVFQKASDVHIATGIVAGQIQAHTRAMRIAALSTPTQVQKLQAVEQDFPNLSILFGLGTQCSCTDCISITSAAAYLVDVLEWLKQRKVVDTTQSPAVTGMSAMTTLFGRRPDIGDIDLNCSNTNTPIPYIDAVCEVLEQAVSPDPGFKFTGSVTTGIIENTSSLVPLLNKLQGNGWLFTSLATVYGPDLSGAYVIRDTNIVCKIVPTTPSPTSVWLVYQLHQTFGTADQVAAVPEYINTAAYLTLQNATYAFNLPFNAYHQEAESYFTQFNITRSSLMQALRQGNSPSEAQLAAEELGFTDTERGLIVTASPFAVTQNNYWGTFPTSALTVLAKVQAFLTKTSLSFSDFQATLTLNWLNPTGSLSILYGANSCDTSTMTIQRLDFPSLDRYHRFIRVHQRQPSWSLTALDQMIRAPSLGNGNLSDSCLNCMNQINKLQAKLSQLTLDTIVMFFDLIPTTGGVSSVWASIFLNTTLVGTVNNDFQPTNVANNELNEKNNPGSGAKLSNTTYISYLALCLGLSVSDMTLIVNSIPSPAILSMANLTSVYSISSFSKASGLQVSDFLIIQALTGINPFRNPQSALNFNEKASRIASSGVKPVDLQYYLTHQATNLSTREYPDSLTASFLYSLQTAFIGDQVADKSPWDPNASVDKNKGTLLSLLGKLLSFSSAANLALFASILDNNWQNQSTTPAAFIDQQLAVYVNTTPIKAAVTNLGGATPSTLDTLRNALIEVVSDEVSLYFYGQDKITSVMNAVVNTFNIASDLASVLLNYASLQSTPLIAILTSDTLAPLPSQLWNPPLTPPTVSSAAFDQQYRATRLLYLMSIFVPTMNLTTSHVQWMLQNNSTLGWLRLDSLPYQTGIAAETFVSWERLQEFLNLATTFPDVQNLQNAQSPYTVYGLFSIVIENPAPAKSTILSYFAQLAGLDSTVLTAIDTQLALSISSYSLPRTFTRLNTAATILRRLQTDLNSATSLLKAELGQSDALFMRQLLKAQYSDSSWLGVLKNIMDPLRRKKRDALVAYILATNDFTSSDDLFEYYLIDVQMGSCMMTSRIVQAHATIQLFIQRCLMGLEPASVADIQDDPGWSQWDSWMNQFRLWQANRLIFLFPENWIEPSLRDDKSEIFVNWENTLQQNALTEDNMESAAAQYLSDLDDISTLDVRCAYYDVSSPSSPTYLCMHVFARTKGGSPQSYYYRQLQQERSWTPWQMVNQDIQDDHLMAFIRNGRLCIAWPVFNVQTNPATSTSVPNPSSIPSNGSPNSPPEQRWQIQLAVSERYENTWKKKTVSLDSLYYPPGYSTDPLPSSDDFYFFVWGLGSSQAVSVYLNDGTAIGSFNLTGCKGYPEPTSSDAGPGLRIFPWFKGTQMLGNCYNGTYSGRQSADNLCILQIFDPSEYDEILAKVVGNFQVTYPMQLTAFDFLLFVLEAYFARSSEGDYILRCPLGTLMPYFYSDTQHDFVIIPGLYGPPNGLESSPVALYSDIYQIFEDILSLIVTYASKLAADPNNLTGILVELLQDPLYQKVNSIITTWQAPTVQFGLVFKTFYHPLICLLRSTFNQSGFSGLMQRSIQLTDTGFDFEGTYSPTEVWNGPTTLAPQIVLNPFPHEVLDFTPDGAYSSYNWELFFHLPFSTAVMLNQNGQFQDAQNWYHYIFNPVGTADGSATPNKYWITKPFYQQTDYADELIDSIMNQIANDPSGKSIPLLQQAVTAWRNNPYEPYVVARSRTVAFQVTLVLNYIQNLIDWGDNLFTQFTRETITQALQLYILADKLLGPQPQSVTPPVTPPSMTFNQLESQLDIFGNALLDLENLIPDLNLPPTTPGGPPTPPPFSLSTLYFCIPQNTNMQTYWTTVADRLFKIRNCQNINGVPTPLSLFAPPIDPGALVRAAAAGISALGLLQGLNAPLPLYRFVTTIQKAKELAQQVNAFGNQLLLALERRDAEQMAQLQSSQQIAILNAITKVKQDSINEGQGQLQNLVAAAAVIQARLSYYQGLVYMNSWESQGIQQMQSSISNDNGVVDMQNLAAEMLLIPTFSIGIAGVGGSPAATVSIGGSTFGGSAQAFASALATLSGSMSKSATLASTQGSYQRRQNEWSFQIQSAELEIAANTQQQTTIGLHNIMLADDLNAHNVQINAQQLQDDLLHSKFTNEDLYLWMIGQLSTAYRSAYNLALATAMKAERCFRQEIGNSLSPPFIQPDYWDDLKKGLLAANGLINDLNSLESAYMEQNQREYELHKQLALSQLDSLALYTLKETGACSFSVPEIVFDLDHPGQYMRRHKAVSLSIPCVSGPYTSITATLSLINSKYRNNNTPVNPNTNSYFEDPGNDPRFTYNAASVQSIATSTAQDDGGLFELNFRDERYLPFEGTGCIATWQIQLPQAFRQFDYDTITDAILHIRYTAREGGSGFRIAVEGTIAQGLNQLVTTASPAGLWQGFNLRQQFPNDWWTLRSTGSISMTIGPQHLPFWTLGHSAIIDQVVWYVQVGADGISKHTLSVAGQDITLAPAPNLPTGIFMGQSQAIQLGTAFTVSDTDAADLVEVNVMVHFTIKQ